MLRRRALMLGAMSAAGLPAMAGPILRGPGDFANPFDPFGRVDGQEPAWRANAAPARRLGGRAAVSIVIDDMGVMQPGTQRAVALAAPLTLSWFPFAKRLAEQIAPAAARGHETTLHMPMQSFSNATTQTGPDPLRIDLPEAENLARLRAAIRAVPGSVGINNHMGAVATVNPRLMELVGQETARHGMLFLDSVVIAHSIGQSSARMAGAPAASRDVFLDHMPNLPSVRAQLELVEQMARRNGSVIAIGHPHPWTLDALEAWLPTVEGKGIVMWPAIGDGGVSQRAAGAGLGRVMLTIYGVYRSRASRNFWLAGELGLEFRHVPVTQVYRLADPDGAGGLHTQSPAFLAVNPGGVIPSIDDDGLVLHESLAINLYLARKHGGALAPADVAEDGLMTMWTLWAATMVEPHSIQVLYHMAGRPPAERDPAVAAAAVAALRGPFAVLDRALAANGHLVGGRFTVADVNLAEVFRYAMPAADLFAAAPHVADWLAACHARPAYEAMMAARDLEPV